MQASRSLSLSPSSPSLNSYSSVNLVEIAARIVEELRSREPQSDDDCPHLSENTSPLDANDLVGDGNAGGDEDFDFAFVYREPESDLVVTADEIFHNGQIRPLYPYNLLSSGSLSHDDVSDPNGGDSTVKATSGADATSPPSLRYHRPALRKLMRKERDSASSSSSEADEELNSVSSETYCMWTPKRANAGDDDRNQEPSSLSKHKIKCNSTGSSKRWKFRDLLYVRSGSDGKEKVVFVEPSKKTEKSVFNSKNGEKKSSLKELPPVTKHGGDSYFTRNGSARAAGEGKDNTKRRSYLPYRKDLVGIFGNVNGLSRKLHPF